MDLSTFKQKPLPDLCLQEKNLVDGLACVDFHEGSVTVISLLPQSQLLLG